MGEIDLFDTGINMNSCKGLDDRAYIKTISQLGFKSTFSDVYPIKRQQEIANLCAEYGVRYETIHAPFGRQTNAMWEKGIPGNEALKQLKNSVDNCTGCGVKIMVVHLSSGENAPPVTDIGRKRFTRLVEYAAKKNVRIAFENQRKLANIAWAFETFDEKSNVGFCWDMGHENCFTPGRKYMPLFGNRLICTHIHDNSGIYNKDEHKIPFDGNIDYAENLKMIKKYGYNGSLMLEVYAKEKDAELPPEKYLEKAAKAVGILAGMF